MCVCMQLPKTGLSENTIAHIKSITSVTIRRPAVTSWLSIICPDGDYHSITSACILRPLEMQIYIYDLYYIYNDLYYIYMLVYIIYIYIYNENKAKQLDAFVIFYYSGFFHHLALPVGLAKLLKRANASG